MAPAKVPTRQLGSDGHQIPAIGIGLMGMSIGYGQAASDKDRLALLDRAWEIGCTNWDTSDIYGDSEDVIGKWFKLHPERRKDIFVASKFGLKATESGIVADSSPEYCRECIDRSLTRLGVDQIDLYYIHRVDPAIPIEKTMEVMAELVQQGKIKYVGLSEISSATLRRAAAIHPIAAVQAEYSLSTTDIEGPKGTNLLDTCRELGVTIFAYSPLGRGILTGQLRAAADVSEPGDHRAGMHRFQGENLQKNLEVVDKIEQIAKKKGRTPGQLALAWLGAQGPDIIPIPGTKRIKYLEENFEAVTVELSEEELASLKKLIKEVEISGERDTAFGAYLDTAPL
ncbi:Aldo/keto reductase [Sarocladium strictum]